MIGMLVLFHPPDGLGDSDQLRHKFCERVQLYEEIEGLKLKTWLIDAPGGRQGGFYIWENREAIDAFMQSDQWKSLPAFNRSEPQVTLFEVPCLVNALEGRPLALTAV